VPANGIPGVDGVPPRSYLRDMTLPRTPQPEDSVIGGFIRTRTDRSAGPSVQLIRGSRLSEASGTLQPSQARGVAEESQNASTGQPRASKWPSRSEGRKRKTKLAVMGIPTEALEGGDPRYARCVRLAAAYRKARVRELAVSHEFVSSGVSGLLATASLALASSRYLYELAAGGGVELDRLPGLLKSAQSLADSARQNELAAWELCARESQARRKMSMNSQQLPWLAEAQPEKRGPGRPRKAKVVEAEVLMLPPVGTPMDGFREGVP
jgi:hypothetical protein